MEIDSSDKNHKRLVDFVCDKIEFMSRPRDCGVVWGSTPVVSFGDFTKAKVATIGINPSSAEFIDKSSSASTNGLFPMAKKRLADGEMLGMLSMDPLEDDTAISVIGPEEAKQIWEGCRDYFKGPNAYWSWFKDLERIVNSVGSSYKDDSACHLDLSPWATDPIFRDLTKPQQERLMLGEADFLRWQIAKSDIELVIFNSAQAFDCLNTLEDFDIFKFGEIEYTSGGASRASSLYHGFGPGGTTVLGWSLNLQALQMTVEEKEKVFQKLENWLVQ
jgi:hypothetical protein